MSSLVISGDTSGTVTLSAPAIAGSNTISVQAATASMSVNTLGTAVASTSGTSIDFTGLPSWIKRITVMFNGTTTSSTSLVQIQLGTSGGVVVTGYLSYSAQCPTPTGNASTTGMVTSFAAGSLPRYGSMILTNITGNTWVNSHSIGTTQAGTNFGCSGGGSIALASALTSVRITTVNGTDTFTAGSINILYEG